MITEACAARAGFRKGGEAEKAENTAVLQDLVNRADHVIIPAVDAVIDRIALTRNVRITQLGGTLKRCAGLNKSLFYANTALKLGFFGLTIDMNPAQNDLEGGHDAIRLTNPIRPLLERVTVLGARGLYAGAQTGASVTLNGGYGGKFEECWFEDGYDGYVLMNHADATDYGSWLKNMKRCGALVSASDRYTNEGGRCRDTGQSDATGAAVLVLNSKDALGKGVSILGVAHGHAWQNNDSLNSTVEHLTVADVPNGTGCDYHQSTGTMRTASIRRCNRGVEDDTLSELHAYDVDAAESTDTDFSVFRSTFQARGCKGNVRLWTNGPTSDLSTAIIENHKGAVTIVSGEAKDVTLSRIVGAVSDPGGHAFSTPKPLAFSNGWVADGEAYFWRDGDTVRVEGRIKSGDTTANTTVFTLPAGYRPSATKYLSLMVCGGFGGVYITTAGEVKSMSGAPLSAVWTSLEGISFKAA